MFLKSSPNSQEKTCATVSLLIDKLKERFDKFLRKAFFIEKLQWLLLNFYIMADQFKNDDFVVVVILYQKFATELQTGLR